MEGYARLFFRRLASRINFVFKIVLDNAQEGSGAVLAKFIKAAANELPTTMQLIVISREPPLSDLVRLFINKELLVFDAKQMRFTNDEAKELFSIAKADPKMINELVAKTEGWVTGLILLRENGRALNTINKTLPLFESNLLYAYFANEVFSCMEQKLQALLLFTAQLRRFSINLAKKLTGDSEVEKYLKTLWRRNLFIHRVRSLPDVYEYHPLFREFLVDRLNSSLPAIERQNIMQQSAHWLSENGDLDDAIELYLKLQNWTQAVTLILARAKVLCSEGRHQTLCRWLSALPEDVRNINPWLSFWLGESYLTGNEIESRRHLEIAYIGFTESGNEVGQLLTSTTILEAIHWGYSSYKDIQKWADITKTLYANRVAKADPENEIRITAGRLLASLLLNITDEESNQVSIALQAILEREIDINRRLAAATILLTYYSNKARLYLRKVTILHHDQYEAKLDQRLKAQTLR